MNADAQNRTEAATAQSVVVFGTLNPTRQQWRAAYAAVGQAPNLDENDAGRTERLVEDFLKIFGGRVATDATK